MVHNNYIDQLQNLVETPKRLVTNYREGGGLQNGRGGACEVIPLRKGCVEKVSAMLKWGHNKFWGSFYTVA